MWRASAPDPADIRRFRGARERLDLYPLAIHVNYLVNLATLDPTIRERSVISFRGELDRAAAIGAEYLVLVPLPSSNRACGFPAHGSPEESRLRHAQAAFRAVC